MLIVLGDDHEYMRKLDKILHLQREFEESIHSIIKQNKQTMATLAEVTASLDALDAAVAAIPTGTTTPADGISAADADAIKARIDADTAALQAKVPAPAPTV
jgi:hypothetical protein